MLLFKLAMLVEFNRHHQLAATWKKRKKIHTLMSVLVENICFILINMFYAMTIIKIILLIISMLPFVASMLYFDVLQKE